MHKGSQKSMLKNALNRKSVKVIAVTGGKGGIGKTNIAANIAIGLGAARNNVCLMDADVSLANVDVLLGLQPRFNLSHVVSGEADLASTMISGPNDIQIVPAASGNFVMTDLPMASQAEIIKSFADLRKQPEVLVVDTASGISPIVARFVQAAQHPMVVVCDEPASLTDAYALIKVFSRHYGVDRFQVVTNRTRNSRHGTELYRKLTKVTDSFLDVVLHHLGDIPNDRFLQKAVQEQRAVVEAYPKSPSGSALLELTTSIDRLPAAREPGGGIEFFFERVLTADRSNYRGMQA